MNLLKKYNSVMQNVEVPIGEPTIVTVTVGKDITPGLQSLDSNSKLWSRFLAGRITASKIKTACYTIA